MKKILKTIVLCALAIFASCSEDIYDSHINENHTTKKNKISFENFKQETGLKDFKTSIKINSNTNIETSKNADGSYNLDDFIIDTDLIKKLTVDDNVTYTFRIQPKIITTKNIFNLTVFKIGDFWKMSILELIPTEQNLINLEAGITDKFEGDVKQIYDDSQTIDNPIGAKVVIFYHCTHTGICANGTCDLCLGWCLTVVTFDEPRSFGTPTGGATESGQNNNDTNNTGGGGNNPGDVLAGSPTYADPSGYTFDPNLPPVGDAFNKAKRATEFWDSLTDGIGSQKEWANLNPDEYNAILDYYLNNYSPEGKDFAVWAINYFLNNPMVTFEQFGNWFIGTAEGKDGDYDAAFWDDPSLTLQQQSLPTLQNFLYAFPKIQNGNTISNMPSSQVYQLVGGSILSNHNAGNSNYQNGCSLRGSRALNYSGLSIPVLIQNGIQKTEKGSDNENYILSAKAFNIYMHKTFGAPTHSLTKVQINNNPSAIADFLKNKTGIYTIINDSPGQAGYGGHVDLIIDGKCLGGANANPKGGVLIIEIWELN